MKYLFYISALLIFNMPIEFSSENPHIKGEEFKYFIRTAEAVGVTCSKRDGTLDQKCLAEKASPTAKTTVAECGSTIGLGTGKGRLRCIRLRLEQKRKARKAASIYIDYASVKRVTASNKLAMRTTTKQKAKSYRPLRTVGRRYRSGKSTTPKPSTWRRYYRKTYK